MSRQREFASLQAAGWAVYVDSPWRRAGDWLCSIAGASVRLAARLAARLAFHPVRRPA
jgi:hypothetical protein